MLSASFGILKVLSLPSTSGNQCFRNPPLLRFWYRATCMQFATVFSPCQPCDLIPVSSTLITYLKYHNPPPPQIVLGMTAYIVAVWFFGLGVLPRMWKLKSASKTNLRSHRNGNFFCTNKCFPGFNPYFFCNDLAMHIWWHTSGNKKKPAADCTSFNSGADFRNSPI